MAKHAPQRIQFENRAHPHFIRPTAVALAVAACFNGPVLANPTAPTVVNGTASFATAGNILNITNSHNAIINWGSFSIGVNELTRFIQPSALSAVLNRVTGQDPSAILGALQSNGRVFLLNPNGIVFGAGSQINVAGLVASTLNLSNDDFLNNRMKFTDGAGAGSVVNNGSITGGSVYLVGNAVTNNGLIASPNGEVVLAAGNSVELVNPGTPNLRVEVVASDNEARNLGTITAEAGRIGIYAGLIKQSGTLSADSAVAEGGRIVLKSTKKTVIEEGSLTSARGTSGGQIIALSGMTDGVTAVAGKLDASATAGNGGFIETSAAKVQVADSAVITTQGSSGGQSGTWLIDPLDIIIGTDISAATLQTALGSSSVVIDTYGGSSFYGGEGNPSGVGNITVNEAVSWAYGSSLTLTAQGDITVNQQIRNTGTGGINLNAGWDGTSPSTSPVIVTGVGAITLNAPVKTAGEIQLLAGGDILQNTGGSIEAAGLLAKSPGGSVNLANPGATNIVGTLAGEGKGQFAFRNSGNLTIGTVGGRDGVAAYGYGGGRHANLSVDVTGGALTVAGTVYAQGGDGAEGQAGGNATITLASTGGISVTNSTIQAVGGQGGSGYSIAAGAGGNASVTLNNTGTSSALQVTSASINADGGEGGYAYYNTGGTGGNATITLTSSGDLNVSGSLVANGGYGGVGYYSSSFVSNGGRGGDASINLSAVGNVNIGTAYGGYIMANGGYGGYPYYSPGDGGRGGDATVSVSAGGAVNMDTAYGGFIGAQGGPGSDTAYGGAGGRGGDGKIMLSAGGAITVASSGISAYGGAGGSAGSSYYYGGAGAGGAGGDGVIQLTAGGDINVLSSVHAQGGRGGDGVTGFVGGRGGDGNVMLSAGGGITVSSSGAVRASGGQGGNNYAGSSGSGSSAFAFAVALAGRGGDAKVEMASTGAMTVSGTVSATGGTGGYGDIGGGDGGDATVKLNSSSTLDVTPAATIYADGGEGYNTTGGNASVELKSTGGLTVSSSANISANGGDGSDYSYAVKGGDATVTVQSGGGLTITSANISANGGYGSSGGIGGNATVTIQSAGGLTISGGSVYAYAGSGSSAKGGDANLLVKSGGGLTISGASVYTHGGTGYSGNGGNANTTIQSTGGDVLIDGGSIYANGGSPYYYSAMGNGGNGVVFIGSAGSTTITNAGIYASGGSAYAYGGTINGGNASIQIQAGGGLTVSNSMITASGGYVGGSGQGGAAGLTIRAGGNIQFEGAEGRVYGGGSNAVGGDAGLLMVAGGNIVMDSSLFPGSYDTLSAVGGGNTPGTKSVVVAAAGDVSLINGASIYSSGLVGLGGANVSLDNAYVYANSSASVGASGSLSLANGSSIEGYGNTYITTGGNVNVDNSHILGSPDVFMTVGGVINMNNGGIIEAGAPTTIHLTFPMLTSGGYFVNGIEGVVYDEATLTGFLADLNPAILGTNLLVTYGGGATLNIPTDALIVAMGESTKPPDPEKDKNVFKEVEDEKKKDAPVCR